MQISMSNKTLKNIDDIFAYLSNISDNYANKTITNIYEFINKLKYFPHIGRYVPELLDKHYRERICDNYRIIYLFSESYNTIFIRYILNAKQNSNQFFKVHKDELNYFLHQNFI